MSDKLNPWLMFRRCMVTGELLCNRLLPDGCTCVKPAHHHGECANHWSSGNEAEYGIIFGPRFVIEDIDPPTHPTP